MASQSLERWTTMALQQLDELEAAHQAVGGTGVGRRTATQQINDAYLMLVAAQFQQFCRDLHTEAATALTVRIQPATMAQIVQLNLTRDRQLDKSNAQPSSIGADFARLGLKIWDRLRTQTKLNAKRQDRLEQLNVWRNAVAHQDFTLDSREQGIVGSTRRTLHWVRTWRSACEVLAAEMDRAVETYIAAEFGTAPW